MTLINIDNSAAIYGDVTSIQLHHNTYGGRYFDIEFRSDPLAVSANVLAIAGTNAKAHDIRAVADTINRVLDDPKELSLYRVQAIVNGSHFMLAEIQITITIKIETTLFTVKSMWQENN